MYKLLKNMKGVKKTLNKKYGKTTIKTILLVVGFLIVLVIGIYLGRLLNKNREGFEDTDEGFFSSDAIMSIKDMDLNSIKEKIDNNTKALLGELDKLDEKDTAIIKHKKALLGELDKLDEKDTAIKSNKDEINKINTNMVNIDTENLIQGTIIPYYPKDNNTDNNNTKLSKAECIELLKKGFIPCDSTIFDGDIKDGIEIQYIFENTIIKNIIKLINNIIEINNGNIIAKIPDLRRKFIVGSGTATGNKEYGDYNIGTTGGSEKHQMSVEEMPSHSHKFQVNTGPTSGRNISCDGSSCLGNNSSNQISGNMNTTGGNQPHENRPPFMAMVYIYYLGNDYRYMENIPDTLTGDKLKNAKFIKSLGDAFV
jgi:hypothetical protein